MRMRGAARNLVRFICSLALVLAALPIRATGMAACDLAATTRKAVCGMTCCAPAKPAPSASCCKAKSSASLGVGDCKCVAGSDSGVPASSGKTFAGIQDQEPALSTVPTFTSFEDLPDIQPGIFGVDSGPPIGSEYVPDLGRAPPVARV